jgi:hypothetical protein
MKPLNVGVCLRVTAIGLLATCMSRVASGHVLSSHGLFVLGGLSTKGGPEGVCLLAVYAREPDGSPGDVLSACSSVLVEKDEVLTAAHCVDDVKPSTHVGLVECGGHDGIAAREVLLSPRYSRRSGAHDIARVRLMHPSPVAPMAVFAPEERRQLLTRQGLPPGVECRVAGYGSGDLVSAPVHTSVLRAHPGGGDQIDSSESTRFAPQTDKDFGALKRRLGSLLSFSRTLERDLSALQDSAGFAEMIGPGDSGGPLYCRESWASPWRVLGINRKIIYSLYEEVRHAGKDLELTKEESWTYADAGRFRTVGER